MDSDTREVLSKMTLVIENLSKMTNQLTLNLIAAEKRIKALEDTHGVKPCR